MKTLNSVTIPTVPIDPATFKPYPEGCLFAAVQNGIILDVFETYDEAFDRIDEEQHKDWFSILTKRSVRKLLKKRGNNIALHTYNIYVVYRIEEIK